MAARFDTGLDRTLESALDRQAAPRTPPKVMLGIAAAIAAAMFALGLYAKFKVDEVRAAKDNRPKAAAKAAKSPKDAAK